MLESGVTFIEIGLNLILITLVSKRVSSSRLDSKISDQRLMTAVQKGLQVTQFGTCWFDLIQWNWFVFFVLVVISRFSGNDQPYRKTVHSTTQNIWVLSVNLLLIRTLLIVSLLRNFFPSVACHKSLFLLPPSTILHLTSTRCLYEIQSSRTNKTRHLLV